jgi:hypothetical protein
MFRNLLRLSACLSLVVMTAACATVTRGVKEAWTVTSEPPSASVTTSNGFSCEATPCTFKIEHKAEFDVTVTKAGYKPYHGHVIHQVSKAGGLGMAGNVLVGGLIGATVDVASGAMMELKPNPLNVTLDRVDAAPPTAMAAPAPAPVSAPAPAPAQSAPPATPVQPTS